MAHAGVISNVLVYFIHVVLFLIVVNPYLSSGCIRMPFRGWEFAGQSWPDDRDKISTLLSAKTDKKSTFCSNF